MVEFLQNILPYISGLYTLPWIVVGFAMTLFFARFFGRDTIDKVMKKIGLILLYFFIPALLFRIFINIDFGQNEIIFSIVVLLIMFFMYLIAYFCARYYATKRNFNQQKRQHFVKTVLTNQGRSSAFIGGALLAFTWKVEAAIYIALVGIALFAVIPAVLSHMHKKESKKNEKQHIHALPWHLKLFPWYLLFFVVSAIVLHAGMGITTRDFGVSLETIFIFFTSLTIPAALYYVGSSIHPRDLSLTELKKLVDRKQSTPKGDHWSWVRVMFFVTVILTPALTALIFTPLFFLGIINNSWYAVIIINSFLPVTSTNMFLLPYGIDKKSTAHIITFTTIFCVPIIYLLISVFAIYIP
ncbi:MAG: hypothetical protein R6V50_00965 [Thermoplasmatota archaeon]